MNIKFAKQASPYINTYKAMKDNAIAKPMAKSIAPTNEMSKSDIEILALAKKIWQDYQQTPEGVAFVKSFETADLATARKQVTELAGGPVFDAIKELLTIAYNHNLIPKSFSIGINIQAELILGFTVTVGAAIGVGDSKGVNMSEFLCVGVTEGLDEGALIGVEFGLWTNSPADLGGWSMFTGVELGAGAEVAGAVSYNLNGGLLGATVVVGGGEEDGADEGECYTFMLGTQNPDKPENPGDGFYLQPAYQPRFQKKNLLIIENLTCNNTKAPSGNDEVYFTFQADAGYTYFYPTYDYYSMDDDNHPWSSWDCGRSVWFNDTVTIVLYDDGSGNHQNSDPLFPNLNSDTLPGSFVVSLSDLILNETVPFVLDDDEGSGDTNYTVNIRLVAQDVDNVPAIAETVLEEMKA